MNRTENEINVFSMGCGTIPRMVMSDRNLTVEAKAIYSYITACIGAGGKWEIQHECVYDSAFGLTTI